MDRPDPKPDLVLYHARCQDGFAAAWVYWRSRGDAAVYVPVRYGQELPPVHGRHVVMVDVSFPRAVIERLAHQASSFRLLDHHSSAQCELQDLPFAYFDQDKSGVGLAWQDCRHPEPLPRLLSLIQARDLQQPLETGGGDVLHVLDSLPHDFRAWSALVDRVEQDFAAVRSEGEHMERQFEALTQRLLVHAAPVSIGGHQGLVVNAPMEFASAVGERLACRAEFGMTWYLDAEGRAHVSWRSQRLNVIPMAQRYGGGGHERAAGARLSLAQLAAVLAAPALARDCPSSPENG